MLDRGPLKQVVDGAGHAFERGRRLQIDVATAELVRRGPLAEQFVFIAAGSTGPSACGTKK